MNSDQSANDQHFSTPADEENSLIDDIRVVLERHSQKPAVEKDAHSTPPGWRLANYEVLKLLGEGGMARVYRAFDHNTNREVALKVLKKEYQASSDICARFEREAAAMVKIQHENVVHVYDFPAERGVTGIAMELLAGGSLRTLLKIGKRRKRSMGVKAIVRFASQVSAGLAAAHDAGVVHRDIKPANLMLDDNGNLKIVDFGIVHAMERATWLTGLGRPIGTPAYMSPEQCKGERVGPSSDIYSFGVTMFELCAGKLPFTGQADSPFALMLKHIYQPVPDIRDLRANLPDWLVGVIKKCLAKEPVERFPNGSALTAAIEHGPDQPRQLEQHTESVSKTTQINTRAIRRQLECLPQRAIVAWACRCARRVQHLNKDQRLERAIAMAESAVYASDVDESSTSLSNALLRVQKLRAISFNVVPTSDPAVGNDAAAAAAIAAAGASACAAARCAADAAADAAFVAQNAMNALELIKGPAPGFWKESQDDYKRLVAAKLGPEGTIGKRLPDDFWHSNFC